MREPGRLVRRLALLLCAVLAGAGAPSRTAPPVGQRPPRSGTELLRRLQAIADHGRIDDVPGIARMLGLQLERQPDNVQANACTSPVGIRRSVASRYVVPRGGLAPTANGIPVVRTPGFAINPPATLTGSPELTVTVTRTEWCTGEWTMLHDSELLLDASALFALDCMSADVAEAALPGSEHVEATDGVSFVRYGPPARRDYGSNLEVEFFAGQRCALGARLTISDRAGQRRSAAEQQDFFCLWRARARYCEAHPQASTADPQLDPAIRRQCGPMETRLQRTPRNATPIPGHPFVDQRPGEPMCSAAKRFVSTLPELAVPRRASR